MILMIIIIIITMIVNSHKIEIRDYIFSQSNLFLSIQGLAF